MNPANRQKALDWAMEHLKQGRESCGVVIIERGKEVFVPCKNISEFNDQFVIDPLGYAAAEDRGEVVRIVHSHPFTSADPSMVDLASCEATGLPWSIVSVPTGVWVDFKPKGFKAPLVGRMWAHGLMDCYSLIRDYYAESLGIALPDFEREFEWWHKGQNLYVENFHKAGFREVPLAEIQEHDVILMQLRSPVINHGAIYLGDQKMLHHVHRRLSGREVYGGQYLKHTSKVLRHESR